MSGVNLNLKMSVKVYRKENFAHTHERQGFRKLVETLEKKFQKDFIYVLANPTLPDVLYHYPGGDKTKSFKGVNPDVILFKEDAIIVVEMKSHSGLIKFPTDHDNIWDEWFFERDGKRVLLNEGHPSPLSQVASNQKALTAFLQEKEGKFAEGHTVGSVWYKIIRIILFTGKEASFEEVHPFKDTFVTTLSSEDSQFDFSSVVQDITTPERKYGTDNTSQIFMTPESIEGIMDILGGKEITKKEDEDGDLSQMGYGYGMATIIAHSSRLVVPPTPDEKTIEPPKGIQNEPLQVKLAQYYARCLEEEAKNSSQLNMKEPQSFFVVKNMPEPIFHGIGKFQIDSVETIPKKFLVGNARLVYGFYFLIQKITRRGKTYFDGYPLFINDVKVDVEKNSATISSKVQSDLILNINSLQKHTAFKNAPMSELDELQDQISELSPKEGINLVLEKIGQQKFEETPLLQDYDPQNLVTGLLPIAIIYEATGGFYQNTIRELNAIAKKWKKDKENNKVPNDLVWKLIEGIGNSDIDQSFSLAPISIIESNFEQSQATALSLNDNNLLQVISGPPGTGKSQVIQNIVANTSRSNQKTLFASHNNKAVDVVVDRLNDIILELPFVFRSGNIAQNSKMHEKLEGYTHVSPNQNIAKKASEVKSDLNKMNMGLTMLKKNYDKHQKAVNRLSEIDHEFDQLRINNEDLFYLTNWYEKQEGDQGYDLWEQLYLDYEGAASKGDKFFKRVIHVISEGMSFADMLSKKQFRETIKDSFIQKLKTSLPEDLFEAIGEKDIEEASKQMMPVLGKLTTLNNEYVKCQEIEASINVDDILNSWETLEAKRMDNSRFILKYEWGKNISTSVIQSAKKLLSKKAANTQLFTETFSGFSCFATTTLSIGRNMPLSSQMFDLAVIDEASQADFASALPILYRSKKAIIIGDEMQIRPIITLSMDKDREIADAYGLTEEEYLNVGYSHCPVLDFGYDRFTRAGGRRLLLRNHYRSYPEIIEYSNQRFYDNLLRIKTVKETAKPAIKWFNVEGQVQPKWKNQDEINEVTQLVQQLANLGIPQNSIGVVTPFRQHANGIIDSLAAKKLIAGVGGKIVVDTAHGFQGDEKDIMIFSLVVGQEMPSGTVRWVHDRNSDSKNLLNVALTRARRKLYIVGNKDFCSKQGGLLGELRTYVDNL